MNSPSWLKAALALLLLNVALSFENIWPTILIKPDTRISPELVLIWAGLLFAFVVLGRKIERSLTTIALMLVLLVLGRYADVTIPALFGRPLNIYWDGLQVPRMLMTASRGLPIWLLLPGAAFAMLFLYALYRVLRWALATVANELIPPASSSAAAWVATGCALVLVAANFAGVAATWPYVSKPVAPTYVRQADLMITAVLSRRLDNALPPSPRFDSDLKLLAGADVKLVFLESYGATVFDTPYFRDRLVASQSLLTKAVAGSGKKMVSALFRSPTFGGGTELAHLALLSGIDLSNPFTHDLLLTTRRPNLMSMFKAGGYRTFGLYASVSWEWIEREHYGYDVFVDGRDLNYRGPKIGLWEIPDQFALARFNQMHPVKRDSAPRFIVFPTINTHIPFRPIPPYQADWSKILTQEPFEAAALARELAEKPSDWSSLGDAYLRSIQYTYQWLSGYLLQPYPRDYLLILVGDHQPAAIVSGDGAPWDVPIHVISSNDALLNKFIAQGFSKGLTPHRPVLGNLNQLTTLLRDTFDSAAVPMNHAPAPRAAR